LREESARLRRGPAELASFAEQAETLINRGDLGGARNALVEGRTAARSLRQKSTRYEADFLAQEAKVNHLQLAYRVAAAKYAEAASLMAAIDGRKQWELRIAQAGELFSQGDELGDNDALAEAINVYRDSLLLALSAQRPLAWAATQNNLGNALARLGERESGTARLEEAIAAYRNALTVQTRERVPLDWATTQNNLGNALETLGERENSTARLEEAVAAHRDALKELTRERVPFDWAATQNNLGLALATLGERESGTARLEVAVAAFRDGLTERTRERVPLDWAMSFGGQGVALMRLAERTKDAAMAETACQQIEAALNGCARLTKRSLL
jgi:tetratricopeptide (TPR) repeat protein